MPKMGMKGSKRQNGSKDWDKDDLNQKDMFSERKRIILWR
jgi:hypothetical protein